MVNVPFWMADPVLAPQAVARGRYPDGAAGDGQHVLGRDAVVVLAGNGQCAAAVDGQVVFREDRRAGFVGFGVGEGIGRAVRQRVLGAVGQGQDGFGRLFRVKRGAVRAR